MADEKDDSQKTEEPSQRKLDDAREKGQIASSREVTTFLLFGVTFLAMAALAPASAHKLAAALREALARAPLTDGSRIGDVLLDLVVTAGWALAPLLALLVAAPIAAAAAQNAILWSTEQIQPKLERISPMTGFGRIFSPKALIELGKGIAKLTLAACAGGAVVWAVRHELIALDRLALPAMAAFLGERATTVMGAVAAAALVIAILDYAHQRFEFMRKMRMSRQEVMDEHKQSDGDPIIKQRLRALRMERARRRMMADVPKSTVVITNPTHFAVALRYVQGEDAAPQVMAKGSDAVAARIREVAREAGVPIVENPPLARALFASVEIGSAIPPAHYQAVAEVIGFVLRLAQRSQGEPPAGPPS